MSAINNSLFIGKVLIQLDKTPSTNSYAKELMAKTEPLEGTAIIADSQTHGRGQYDKKWESGDGLNIILSIILYPNFLEINKQYLLNMAICNGLADFCFEVIKKAPSVKWPNDILYDDLKLAGVLIENTIKESKIASSVIGIGMNVNQTTFAGYVRRPISLKMITGETYEIKELLNRLFECIESQYLQLRSAKFVEIHEKYNSRLFRLNKATVFKYQTKNFIGKIKGVDDLGKLLIEHNGSIKSFAHGEIQMLIE